MTAFQPMQFGKYMLLDKIAVRAAIWRPSVSGGLPALGVIYPEH